MIREVEPSLRIPSRLESPRIPATRDRAPRRTVGTIRRHRFPFGSDAAAIPLFFGPRRIIGWTRLSKFDLCLPENERTSSHPKVFPLRLAVRDVLSETKAAVASKKEIKFHSPVKSWNPSSAIRGMQRRTNCQEREQFIVTRPAVRADRGETLLTFHSDTQSLAKLVRTFVCIKRIPALRLGVASVA